MTTIVSDDVQVIVPEWVNSLDEFRRWVDEPDFPDKANVWWLRGGVWVDMSMEQIFTHLDVKGEVFVTIKSLLREDDIGRVFTDGLLFTNERAGISGKPDATFISHESRRNELVTFIEGREAGFTQIVGSPDMLLEVVSDSSEVKDLETLLEDYYTAGVREYWLIDARGDDLRFEIYRRGKNSFVPTRKQTGWMKSAVFGKSFRLVRTIDEFGDPRYRLDCR